MTIKRRHWVLGAAGAGAALLGAGLAWRQGRPAALSPTAQAFWSGQFTTPDGQALDLQAWRGKPLLLNFWATWCAPCVKEMPELDQFARAHAGWQVLGLAVDSAAPVRDYLRKVPVGFAIGMAGLTGTDLARTLGNLQGGLPFSVAFDRAGEPVWRKLGPTNLAELQELARSQG